MLQEPDGLERAFQACREHVGRAPQSGGSCLQDIDQECGERARSDGCLRCMEPWKLE